MNLRILPDLVKAVLHSVDKSRNLAKFHLFKVIEASCDGSEVLVNDFRLFSKILILLASIILPLIFKPQLDLISGLKDAFCVFLVVVSVHHV